MPRMNGRRGRKDPPSEDGASDARRRPATPQRGIRNDPPAATGSRGWIPRGEVELRSRRHALASRCVRPAKRRERSSTRTNDPLATQGVRIPQVISIT